MGTTTPKRARKSESRAITPNALAEELFGTTNAYRMGKQVRAYLRSNMPRDRKVKGSNWSLTGAQAANVRKHFADHPARVKPKRVAKPKAETQSVSSVPPETSAD